MTIIFHYFTFQVIFTSAELTTHVVWRTGDHAMQVHVADKCELGVYSCFNDLVAVSHNFKVPSGLEYAKYSPFGENATGTFAAILTTWVQVRMNTRQRSFPTKHKNSPKLKSACAHELTDVYFT